MMYGGGRGEGLSETQGAGPLEAGKKCSAVGINQFCIIIKHQGIGILRLRLSDMVFLGVFFKFPTNSDSFLDRLKKQTNKIISLHIVF